jgi:plasmid stabilization system protein ParE
MAAKPVEFHPAALAEAEATVAWYGERSFSAAQGFLTELERAIQAISEAPNRWPLFEQGCRRFPLRRFPYLLVYREKPASIEVVAVAHGRRRPGYWRPRTSL